MSKKSDKKPTVKQYLYSLDRKLDITNKVLAEEITLLRNEISRLNETIYEDRRVLADFVAKFFKDTTTVLNPDLAIDGGKKAKSK